MMLPTGRARLPTRSSPDRIATTDEDNGYRPGGTLRCECRRATASRYYQVDAIAISSAANPGNRSYFLPPSGIRSLHFVLRHIRFA